MKINKILCAVAVLVLTWALIACKDDEGLSLPNVIKASELKQNFEGNVVATEDEAMTLLNAVLDSWGNSSFFSLLEKANDDAFLAAFEKNYGKSRSVYTSEQFNNKKASSEVNIDDNEILKNLANSYDPRSDVTVASYKGKSKESIKSNLPIAVYKAQYNIQSITPTLEDGDYIASENSYDKTFAITNGFYTFSSGTSVYKIQGYVTYEASNSYERTKRGEKGVNDSTKYDISSSSWEKISATLSISNGTKGGKFILSSAYEGNNNSTARTIEENTKGEDGSIRSDIEVYDNNNTLILTIRASKNKLADKAVYFYDSHFSY
ncbi:MAG: hypothetical protein LBV17_00815 [Treponema sp.]|jgi:hypothetical protein|nr:hypothetical protein [Treponema sp.]